MRSLLAQERVELRVVAVDDRSGDGTGAILDGLARADPRLEVIHVAALPDGWLGKNHACHEGALRARGDWVLFTDADVVFAPDALRRAVDVARAHGLGHLAVAPRLVAPGLLERAFVTFFTALLAPLVRVADLRRSGEPQGVAAPGPHVQVRWQHGFAPSVLGLVKNAFAALEYRPAVALAGAAGAALAGAAPLAILLAGPGVPARVLAGLALAIALAHHAAAARHVSGSSGAEALLLPLCALSFSAAVLASAVVAWARGGVVWRGTHYPLERVRAGCLRDADLPASGAVGWDGPARSG
jgi:glycosyltransferase involved in cell wall biosynthesis